MRAPFQHVPYARSIAKALAFAAVSLFAASCGPSGSQVPADVANSGTCTISATTMATWFKSGSITLDGEVTPADSVNFTDVPNCDFYVWSERMFLWLTSPAPPSYGGGGGRIFASPAFFDVSPEDSSLHRTLIAHSVGRPMMLQLRDLQKGPHEFPLIEDKRTGQFFELAPTQLSARKLPMISNNQGQLVEIQRAEFSKTGGPPALFDPNGAKIDFVRLRESKLDNKTIPEIQKFTLNGRTVFFNGFGDFLDAEQAEADTGVLMAQNQSLVYYTIEVNDVYGYFASGVHAGAISATHFPISAADETSIQTYAATKGVTSFPDPEALTVELKTAWVEATSLPAGCNYITMQATIPTYNQSSTTVWPKTGTTTVTLAMIGMHVVGSTGSTNPANTVHGHPEMIWATFEHKCNAPTASYTYNGASSNENGPAETGPWLLSSTDTPAGTAPKRQTFNSSASPQQIDAQPAQTIGPSDVQRQFPWGMAGSTSGSNTQVIAADHSVLTNLAAGDVRANYIMTGATWRIFGGITAPQVGTNQLANTTMETFVQGSNCFGCHSDTSAPGQFLGDSSGGGLSHIFGEIQPLP